MAQSGKGTPRLLLRIDEVADTLSVCRLTVENLVKRGELQSVKIGRAVRIPSDSVRLFIERQIAA